jgi:hypothetical protein
MVLESGVRVSVEYTRERVRGVTPAGIGTPAANIAIDANGGGTGLSKFTRAAGSWITDGFTRGQLVRGTGFTLVAANVGNWPVVSVSATDLVVSDPTDALTDEAAGAGKNVRIVLQKLRLTQRAINPQRDVVESEEVRDDRQKSDVRHGFERVVGNFGYELSPGSFDDLLEVAMASSWSTASAVVTTGANLQALVVSATQKGFVRTVGSFITDGWRPGDTVKGASFTAPGLNNFSYLVTFVTATTLSIDDPDNTFVAEADASGRTLTQQGSRIDPGTLLDTLYVERKFGETGKVQPFNGVTVNEIEFSATPTRIAGGRLSMIGIKPLTMASASLSALTSVPVGTKAVLAGFQGALIENGIKLAVVTNVQLTLNNNRTSEAVIGSRNTPDIFEGDAVVSGTLTAFFEDETLYNKFINESSSFLVLRMLTPDKASWITVVVPNVKYMGADMDPPPRGPVPITMPFRGLVATVPNPSGATVTSSLTLHRSP